MAFYFEPNQKLIGFIIEFLPQNGYIENDLLERFKMLENNNIIKPYGYEVKRNRDNDNENVIIYYSYIKDEHENFYEYEKMQNIIYPYLLELMHFLHVFDKAKLINLREFELDMERINNINLINPYLIDKDEFIKRWDELTPMDDNLLSYLKIQNRTKIIRKIDYEILCRKRCDFIELLVKKNPKDKRWKRLLDIYYKHRIQFDNSADKKMRDLAHKLVIPTVEIEIAITEIISNHENEKRDNISFKIRNKNFFKYLECSAEEMELYYDLRTSNCTRDFLRKKKKQERDNDVIRMHLSGLSIKEIALSKNLNRKTVSKIIKDNLMKS